MTSIQQQQQAAAAQALHQRENHYTKAAATTTSASLLATGPQVNNYGQEVFVDPTIYQNQGPMPMRRRGGDMSSGFPMWRMWCILATLMAELVGVFFVGLTFGVRDMYVAVGQPDPGFFFPALVQAGTIIGVMAAFSKLHAGHLNPAFTIIDWLCKKNMWNTPVIAVGLGMLLMQFLGYLFAAWLVQAVQLAPPAAPLTTFSCTVINPLVGNGLGFALESIFLLALIFINVMTMQRKTVGVVGILALGLATFAALALLGPLTGASLNLMRSIGFALVFGSPCADSLGLYTGVLFAALVVAVIFMKWIFPAKCMPNGDDDGSVNIAINTVQFAPTTTADGGNSNDAAENKRKS